MRTMQRNKQKMYFANYVESEILYERDEDGNIVYETYIDTDGEEYTYPKEIGTSEAGYSEPQEMYANIAMSGGEAEAREFGLDVSDYSAVIITDKNAYNLDESSLIWFESPIGYKEDEPDKIEPNSADYRIKKVSPSLNYSKYALERVINNG